MIIKYLKNGIISGMILGDGHLCKFQRRLVLSHTSTQLNYLRFKLALGEQLGYNVRCFRETKKRTTIGIFSYCSGYINGFDIGTFYLLNLPELLNELNSLGLLIWWLDDGCLSIHTKLNRPSTSRFGYLNTQGYSLEENQLISHVLFSKFEIETNIHIDTKSGFGKKDHYRIYINASNMRKMIDLFREFIPWIPKNMLYKLNMKYVENRVKESKYLVSNYNF